MFEINGGIESESPRSNQIVQGIKKEIRRGHTMITEKDDNNASGEARLLSI